MTDCGMWHCKQKVFTPLNPLWVGFVPIQQILIAVWAAEKARRMKPSSPGAPGEGGRLCWTGPGWMWSGSVLPCSAMIHGCPLPALSATVLLSSKPPRWWIPLISYYFFPSDYFPVNPFLGSELNLCIVKDVSCGATERPEAKGPCGCRGAEVAPCRHSPWDGAATLPAPPALGEPWGSCCALPWRLELREKGASLFYTILENDM